MPVSLVEWIGLLRKEYLSEFIPSGGAAVKLAVVPSEQIPLRIGRHHARLLLGSLALWLSEIGYAGLALLLDLDAVVTDYPPGANPVRYTRNAVLDTYEVLRQFIDDTDEMSHLLVVGAA